MLAPMSFTEVLLLPPPPFPYTHILLPPQRGHSRDIIAVSWCHIRPKGYPFLKISQSRRHAVLWQAASTQKFQQVAVLAMSVSPANYRIQIWNGQIRSLSASSCLLAELHGCAKWLWSCPRGLSWIGIRVAASWIGCLSFLDIVAFLAYLCCAYFVSSCLKSLTRFVWWLLLPNGNHYFARNVFFAEIFLEPLLQ